MENPEAMLDVLSMETFRQRLAVHTNNGHGFHANTFQFLGDDDQLEDIVRDLCIDDSISGCFVDSESEVKDTFDVKVWLPNPKKDESQRTNFQRKNTDLPDSVSHLTSSAVSDENLIPLHDLTETGRKGPFSESTDGRVDLCQRGDIGNRFPCKPGDVATTNLPGETSTMNSFNHTNIFSKTPASVNDVPSGFGSQNKLPHYDTYSATGNRTEMCNKLIPSSHRSCSVGHNSEALEKKNVGMFQSEWTESKDDYTIATWSSSSSIPTSFSQHLNIDTQPKKSVFQRMASNSRMGKKMVQYQDQRVLPIDESYAHYKTFPFLSNGSSCVSHQTEVTPVKDQSEHDRLEKMNLRTCEVTSNSQMSYSKEKQGMCFPVLDFSEKADVISYENINSLTLGLGNPEPYVLPSFPATSQDLTTSRMLGSELSFDCDGFQTCRQTFRKAVISHNLPEDTPESIPHKSVDCKRGKLRKPWYEVDDGKVSGKSQLHKNQNVNLRAVIEESARVISPEPDTSSDDPVDERISSMSGSKTMFPSSGKVDLTTQLESKCDENSPTEHSHRLNHSPQKEITCQGGKSHLSAADGFTNSNGLDHICENIRSTCSTTGFNTLVSSKLDATSTSVYSNTKTLPSFMPVITNTSSNVSAIPRPTSSEAKTSSPFVKDFSLSISPSIDTIDTSVSSNVDVISTPMPARSDLMTSISRATPKSVSCHTSEDSTSLPYYMYTLTNTAPLLSSMSTSISSVSPTTHVTSTSDSLDLKVILKTQPDDYNSETSMQLDTHGTVTSANNMDEFNERLRAYIHRDEPDVLRNVVSNDIFIHATDCEYDHDKKFTPYHLAIQLGRLECLRILLESQPLLDRYGWGERLGLDLAQVAVRSNQVQCLLLLHHKMEPSLMKGPVDGDGNTLMHLAASLNHTDIIVALLSLGHDVNIENKAGISSLNLCLQNCAFSKDIVHDQMGNEDRKQSRDVQKSDQEQKVNDSDSQEKSHASENNPLPGESSRRSKFDTALNLRTVENGGPTPPTAHGDSDATCPITKSSVTEDSSGKESDTNDSIEIGLNNLLFHSEAKALDKANGQNTIMNLILVELMRCMSKLHDNSQSFEDNSTPAISEMELVTSLLDQRFNQVHTGEKEDWKAHAITKGDKCHNRSWTDEELQRFIGASNPEVLVRQCVLKYLKSLQENQKGVSQSNEDNGNVSPGPKVKSKQSLATPGKFAEEKVFKGNFSGAVNNFIKNSPSQSKETQDSITRRAVIQDGYKHSVEKKSDHHQGNCGDQKSYISPPDSKSKEVDSFCISSDELYNSPPDKIPTVPTKLRSSRQQQNARTRPVVSLDATSADSNIEVKAYAKVYERDKPHCLNTRQDFKNHKTKSEISYILDSSSTSQDPSEGRRKDFLNDTNIETARRREARRRRWGGLSLLPHHLKKKIERLSQKGKRKTVSGGISGSSNSSSSIVTSSSSSGRGDQSAEGGSSVRAIVDYCDGGQDRPLFSSPRAPGNHHTPMHVRPTRSANFTSVSNRLHASCDVRDIRYTDGRTLLKHDTEVTNYSYDKDNHSESRDSDRFWRSTDTFSSMTAVSEDNEIDVINSINDISVDDGHDSVSGFYDVHQSRSHRHHHHHSHHHHHRSRSSDQSERDRYYHNHRRHHRRRRREALGCSPTRRRHRRSDNGSEDNADIDEGDNDTSDDEEETDASDDPRVRVNVDNEEWPDEMLRVQRLAKHLESVQRLQTGNCQVIEMVITGTGEVLSSQEDGCRDPNHVNIGEAYPFSCHDTKGKPRPLRTKRTTSPSGLVGRRAKINLFNHEKLTANGDAKTGQNEVPGFGNMEATAIDRCREMDRDVPWNLLTFSDSEDTDCGEMNSR